MKKNATNNPENGEEMAELFRAYYGAQMEIYSNKFEQEQEKNYVYPKIFTVSADFPEEPAIEEAFSFEGDLDEPKKVPRSF